MKTKTRNDTVVVAPRTSPATTRRMSFRLGAHRVESKKALRDEFLHRRGTRGVNVFISRTADDLAALSGVGGEQKGNLRLLILEEAISAPRREFFETLFRTVIAPSDSVQLIDDEELVEVMSAVNRDDLFIGGTVNADDGVIILYRGNLERLAIPLSWFARPEKPQQPDFEDFEVIDYGQTVRFGEFEASGDAILYVFDSDYRTKAKRRQIQSDESFGAALRRARLLKGVARSGFAPLSTKTIARIERNEVEQPQNETLAIIAKKLGLRPEEIATF